MAKKKADHKPLTPFALLLAVRDSGCVRNAQRQLLDALVMRCRPEHRYMAFPSYRVLAEDTGLTVKTLQAAAQALVQAELVTRVERPHRSNKFYVHAERIVSLASEARGKKKARTNDLQTDDCPYPDFELGNGGADSSATDDDALDSNTWNKTAGAR